MLPLSLFLSILLRSLFQFDIIVVGNIQPIIPRKDALVITMSTGEL